MITTCTFLHTTLNSPVMQYRSLCINRKSFHSVYYNMQLNNNTIRTSTQVHMQQINSSTTEKYQKCYDTIVIVTPCTTRRMSRVVQTAQSPSSHPPQGPSLPQDKEGRELSLSLDKDLASLLQLETTCFQHSRCLLCHLGGKGGRLGQRSMLHC